MWATMAAKHSQLPKPLQPKRWTFPPPDPTAQEMPSHSPAGPSQDPLARFRYL